MSNGTPLRRRATDFSLRYVTHTSHGLTRGARRRVLDVAPADGPLKVANEALPVEVPQHEALRTRTRARREPRRGLRAPPGLAAGTHSLRDDRASKKVNPAALPLRLVSRLRAHLGSRLRTRGARGARRCARGAASASRAVPRRIGGSWGTHSLSRRRPPECACAPHEHAHFEAALAVLGALHGARRRFSPPHPVGPRLRRAQQRALLPICDAEPPFDAAAWQSKRKVCDNSHVHAHVHRARNRYEAADRAR